MHDKSGNIIYIGKAKILPNRVTSYFRNTEHNDKTEKMISCVDDFEVILTSDEMEALLTECSLIKKYSPKYNIALKNGRGYPFIHFYEDNGSPVLKLETFQSSKGKYMGPFISRQNAMFLLNLISKIFCLPTCKKNNSRKKTCLDYDIHRCLGYCCNKQSSEQMNFILDGISKIFDGNIDTLKQDTVIKMNKAADELNFEKAAELRDKIKFITAIADKQKTKIVQQRHADYISYRCQDELTSVFMLRIRNGYIVGERSDIFTESFSDSFLREYIERFYSQEEFLPNKIYINGDYEWVPLINVWLKNRVTLPVFTQDKSLLDLAYNNASERLLQYLGRTQRSMRDLNAFCEFTGIDHANIIEIYDVSHLAGSDVVCGMVTCVDGQLVRDRYRKFKIGKFDGKDDTAYMSEAVIRRLQRYKDNDPKFSILPDVIICDGGLGQIHAVQQAVRLFGYNINVIGLKKDSRHRTKSVVFGSGKELLLAKSEQVFSFCGRLQETVHHYAISYHQSLRDVTLPRSELTAVKGLGKAKIKLLFDKFETIEKIKSASVEDLCSVKGITKILAEKIKEEID